VTTWTRGDWRGRCSWRRLHRFGRVAASVLSAVCKRAHSGSCSMPPCMRSWFRVHFSWLRTLFSSEKLSESALAGQQAPVRV